MQIEEDSFWFKHRNNIIANSVQKHSPNKTFFDIGGGNGFVAKRLQNDGIKLYLLNQEKVVQQMHIKEELRMSFVQLFKMRNLNIIVLILLVFLMS